MCTKLIIANRRRDAFGTIMTLGLLTTGALLRHAEGQARCMYWHT